MSEKKNYRVGLSLSDINQSLNIELTEEKISDILKNKNIKFKIVDPSKQFLYSIKSALSQPYKRGASVLNDSPHAFDCSSLVSWAAVEAGFSIPRVSIDQFVFSKRVDKEDLRIGDLIFANTKEIIHIEGSFFSKILNKEVKEEPIRTETLEYMPGTKVPEGIDHVGVYMGENKVIHSSSKNGGVKEEDLTQSRSFQNIIGYGRIINDLSDRFIIEIPPDLPELRNRENLIKELQKDFGK